MYVISHYVQHRHHMYVHLHGASRSAWHQYLYINIMYTDNLDCNKQNRDKINAVRKKHCSETIVKKNKNKKRGKFGQMNTNFFLMSMLQRKSDDTFPSCKKKMQECSTSKEGPII